MSDYGNKNVPIRTAVTVFGVLILFRILSLRPFTLESLAFDFGGYVVISAAFGILISRWTSSQDKGTTR